jgi:hypothetical protein
VTDERDLALAELEAAGVLIRAGFDDTGRHVYRMAKFPVGEEGERLKALFDKHIQGRNRLDDSAPSR